MLGFATLPLSIGSTILTGIWIQQSGKPDSSYCGSRVTYQTFVPMKSYKKLSTEFYDLDKPQAPKETLAFLLEHLVSIQGPILEPMSGSGRILIPLLRAGINVEGFDASSDMLQACRLRCARDGITPVLYEGYLESIRLSKSYAVIFIPSGSFGLITDPNSVKGSLEQLFEWLTPSGKLIVEIETTVGQTAGLKEWASRSVVRPDGAHIVYRERGNYFPEEKINHILGEYQLIKDGQLLDKELEQLSIRYYELMEFSGLLSNAGFAVVDCRAPHGNSKATPADNGAIFVCRKS